MGVPEAAVYIVSHEAPKSIWGEDETYIQKKTLNKMMAVGQLQVKQEPENYRFSVSLGKFVAGQLLMNNVI
jgi:hypothetical protein